MTADERRLDVGPHAGSKRRPRSTALERAVECSTGQPVFVEQAFDGLKVFRRLLEQRIHRSGTLPDVGGHVRAPDMLGFQLHAVLRILQFLELAPAEFDCRAERIRAPLQFPFFHLEADGNIGIAPENQMRRQRPLRR